MCFCLFKGVIKVLVRGKCGLSPFFFLEKNISDDFEAQGCIPEVQTLGHYGHFGHKHHFHRMVHFGHYWEHKSHFQNLFSFFLTLISVIKIQPIKQPNFDKWPDHPPLNPAGYTLTLYGVPINKYFHYWKAWPWHKVKSTSPKAKPWAKAFH